MPIEGKEKYGNRDSKKQREKRNKGNRDGWKDVYFYVISFAIWCQCLRRRVKLLFLAGWFLITA